MRQPLQTTQPLLDTYIGTSAYLILAVPAILLVVAAGGYVEAGWLSLFYLPTLTAIALTERRDRR